MDVLFLIMGILICAGIGYAILEIKAQNKPSIEDEIRHKTVMEIIENLRREMSDSGSKNRVEIQNRMDKLIQNMTTHQNSSRETIQKQLSQSAKIISEVTEKLTKLDSTNKQVVGFAEQMKSLENILKNPKHRGVLGEYFLESMLGSVLSPTQYKMQHKFDNGEIVDAAIYIKDQIIPIDSKFSLEKFNKIMQETDQERRAQYEKEFRSDVKKRIDETSKYVRPEEQTTDFAFMYIPAEGVYHSLLINSVGTSVNTQNLIEYAFSKRVVIVSPSSFVAYLQTVLQGLNQLKMEQNFKDIRKAIIQLGKHVLSFDERMRKVGTHLGTTVSMYNQSYKEFNKINKDISKITEGESGGAIEVMTLEKPQV